MILGLITARGGSKGVPKKNIKRVAGKHLIVWTIEAALKSSMLSRVVLSTDDKIIAEIGKNNTVRNEMHKDFQRREIRVKKYECKSYR